MATYEYSSGGFPVSPVTDDVLNINGTAYKYNGSAWEVTNATTINYEYTATADQTTFTGADSAGITLAYTNANVHVFLNGVLLDDADYTATTGTSIVLAAGASVNDIIQIVSFGVIVEAPAGGGGAMELISSQTVTSSVSSVEFTGLTGTYSTYKLVIHGNTLTDGSGLRSRFYAGDGTDWHSFTYTYSVSYLTSGSISMGYGTTSTGAEIYNMHQNFPCSFSLDITVNDNNNVSYQGAGLHNYNGWAMGMAYGHSSDTHSVTTLKMEAPPSFVDTFNAGTFTLYGIKDS